MNVSISLIHKRLDLVAKRLEANSFSVERIDNDTLLAGYPNDFFMMLTIYEDAYFALGFDLTSHPQDVAKMTIVVSSISVPQLLQPHFTDDFGETHFGDAAYDAYDHFIRTRYGQTD